MHNWILGVFRFQPSWTITYNLQMIEYNITSSY